MTGWFQKGRGSRIAALEIWLRGSATAGRLFQIPSLESTRICRWLLWKWRDIPRRPCLRKMMNGQAHHQVCLRRGSKSKEPPDEQVRAGGQAIRVMCLYACSCVPVPVCLCACELWIEWWLKRGGASEFRQIQPGGASKVHCHRCRCCRSIGDDEVDNE